MRVSSTSRARAGGLAVLVAAAACGGESGPSPEGVPTDAGVVDPGEYEDPFVRRSRLSTSTFIEIQEVRARDDGLVLFCTGVRGLVVADGSDPANMSVERELASSLGSSSSRCAGFSIEEARAMKEQGLL